MVQMSSEVGAMLRDWRARRRVSQLDLALDADVSARHLSFVETGRARPSRELLLRLSEQLDVPRREQNALLLAAGFAPAFPERDFADPALDVVRAALDTVLTAHEPFPALIVDRHLTLISANRALAPLIEGVDPALLEPPVNVLRLTLHPDGVSKNIVNLAEWRGFLLRQLDREIAQSGDATLIALRDEMELYPKGPASDVRPRDFAGVAVPFRLQRGDRILSFYGARTVFGSPIDLTLDDLALETFLPADAQTADAMRELCPPSP
jgi:transcriptional regulator with XRE-family HTH domain